MRAKPSSNTRSAKSRANSKPSGRNARGIVKKKKETQKKIIPDLSVLRQPVDTSICGLKQAVKVFETGTPEVLHLLTYDCDVVYECKVCRNLFRSIANFISHKRVYCTLRYSRSQDLQRSNKEGDNCTVILGDKASERLPTRITARKDLTSIVESLSKQSPVSGQSNGGERFSVPNAENKTTTVHLQPMENTSYGVFQTVLKSVDNPNLMRDQVTELQNLLSKSEVILGPDGRVLENGLSDLQRNENLAAKEDSALTCSFCNIKFANRRNLSKHKKLIHEAVRTSYTCPCCKNNFANLWGVYRHLYKVHRKTNEQVRRLRSQIHRKDVKNDPTPVTNGTASKKLPSPSRKKLESEERQRLQQDNKEWMDHLEDDYEFQQCGGCGKRFERKAALTSHSQLCQKRIAVCNNKLELAQPAPHPVPAAVTDPVPAPATHSFVPVTTVALCKKPLPKPSPEKKIGIQVRMNYCKNGSSAGTQICTRRSALRAPTPGPEDNVMVPATNGVIGKEPLLMQVPFKNSIGLKDSSVFEQFLKNATSKCESVEKVSSYLNKSTNQMSGKLHTYISTCKRSTVMRSNVGKSKTLEAKCLQLRSALENGLTSSLKKDRNQTEGDNAVFYDSNVDNTSESNTSAVSSLSGHLTPLADKQFVCEVEQSIEIKNINISRKLESSPTTEADSTSNNGALHLTYNSRTYKGNITFSPTGEATCEEVSTSVTSDGIPQIDTNLQVDSSCLNDDEISIDFKPLKFSPDSKSSVEEHDLGNTISILTRNQLKTICKDDLLPKTELKDSAKKLVHNKENTKKRQSDADVEAMTREMIKKKLYKYIDQNTNRCKICKKKFKNIYRCERHLIIHTMWKRYQCLYNECQFQTFFKNSCLHHVTLHTKDNHEQTSISLAGVINPNKWDLRIRDKSDSPEPSRTPTRANSSTTNKDASPKKLVKTVNGQPKTLTNSPQKTKPRLTTNLVEETDGAPSKVTVKRGETKQRLLTDFKSFNGLPKMNGIIHAPAAEAEIKEIGSPKRKAPVRKPSPRKSKSSPVTNIAAPEDIMDKESGKTANSKQKNSPTDLPNEKLTVINGEVKEEILAVDNASYENNESQSSINIQSSQIVDGSSSLEEEESQESEKSVDESHLKKIFMEVIFGPPPKVVQSSSRPIRNKTRPKRDSDFILGSQKDNDLDGKSNTGKRSLRISSESKSVAELSKKSK